MAVRLDPFQNIVEVGWPSLRYARVTLWLEHAETYYAGIACSPPDSVPPGTFLNGHVETETYSFDTARTSVSLAKASGGAVELEGAPVYSGYPTPPPDFSTARWGDWFGVPDTAPYDNGGNWVDPKRPSNSFPEKDGKAWVFNRGRKTFGGPEYCGVIDVGRSELVRPVSPAGDEIYATVDFSGFAVTANERNFTAVASRFLRYDSAFVDGTNRYWFVFSVLCLISED